MDAVIMFGGIFLFGVFVGAVLALWAEGENAKAKPNKVFSFLQNLFYK